MKVRKQNRKLEERSLELKKNSSRQLREGAKSVGSLILEENIAEISALLLEASISIDEIFNIRNEINKEYVKMVDMAFDNNEYDDAKREELQNIKNKDY